MLRWPLWTGMSGTSFPKHNQQSRWRHPAIRWTVQGIVLFGLWLALSGRFELEFLVIGVLTAAAGIALSEGLFRGTHEGKFAPAQDEITWLLGAIFRFVLYLPWLTYQVILSNFHVAFLVLHPKLPIDPSLVEFDTSLVSERAQVLLAQSITLTPGTVTVDTSNGKFLVHCLSAKSREGLAEGSIQTKIGDVLDPELIQEDIRILYRPEPVSRREMGRSDLIGADAQDADEVTGRQLGVRDDGRGFPAIERHDKTDVGPVEPAL